jgi:3-dehydroquinate synthase
MPNHKIISKYCNVFTGDQSLKQAETFGERKFFVLVDNNTRKYCLPLFLKKSGIDEGYIDLIEINDGESNKNLETCKFIWNELLLKEADRNSVLINLGGGVVTDIGGFAASCFKRGIDFINIPTTLMGQVDAAIGGKTGVNLGNI